MDAWEHSYWELIRRGSTIRAHSACNRKHRENLPQPHYSHRPANISAAESRTKRIRSSRYTFLKRRATVATTHRCRNNLLHYKRRITGDHPITRTTRPARGKPSKKTSKSEFFPLRSHKLLSADPSQAAVPRALLMSVHHIYQP